MMKFLIRLTKSNRLTFPYVFHQLAKMHVPVEDVILCHSVEDVLKHVQNMGYKERQSSVIFYSFMTPHIKWVHEEIQFIKKTYQDVLIVAGGPHTTGDPMSSLKMGFDVAYAGEVEKSFQDFIKWLQAEWPGKHKPTIYYAEPVDSIDDSFPMNPYLFFYPPLEITRGCFWRCRFCQTSTKKSIHRNFDSIKIYVRELKRVGFLNRVGFICPSASEYGADSPRQLQLEKVEQLLSYLKQEGTQFLEFGIFPSETRPNRINEDFLKIVKKYCSNKKITIGAQVASDHLLRKLRRGHLVDHVFQATEMVYRMGFKPLLDFIIGFPGETVEERMETFTVMKELARKYKARMQMHYFLPLSGTPLANNLPTLLDSTSKEILDHFNRSGIASSWWREGMKRSWDLVDTMKKLEGVILDDVRIIYASQETVTCKTSRTIF